jgi:indolepyruvate ferredoxin oxidoreductase
VEGAEVLERAHITFQPGLNEDLAATALWGSQQVNLYAKAKYDGVFGMWYGKGPGVDRCGDVFKHANHAGTSKHGGVLVLAGDDHGAKSSTLPHQSDHQFSAALIPVSIRRPVQEILDLGLTGWAMSRYSGCWVGFKCVADTVESSSSVDIGPDRTQDHRARRLPVSAGRRVDPLAGQVLETEARMQDYKVYAALH